MLIIRVLIISTIFILTYLLYKYYFVLFKLSNIFFFRLTKLLKVDYYFFKKMKLNYFNYLFNYTQKQFRYKANLTVLRVFSMFFNKILLHPYLSIKYAIIYYTNWSWKHILKLNIVSETDHSYFFRLTKIAVYLIYHLIQFSIKCIYYIYISIYKSVYYTLYTFYIIYRMILAIPRTIWEVFKGLLALSSQIIWYIVSSLWYMFFSLFVDFLYLLYNLPQIIIRVFNFILGIFTDLRNLIRKLRYFIRNKIFKYIMFKYSITIANLAWGLAEFNSWLTSPSFAGVKRFWYWISNKQLKQKQKSTWWAKLKYLALPYKLICLWFYNFAYYTYWFSITIFTLFAWVFLLLFIATIAYMLYEYIVSTKYDQQPKLKVTRPLSLIILYIILFCFFSIILVLSAAIFIAFYNTK